MGRLSATRNKASSPCGGGPGHARKSTTDGEFRAKSEWVRDDSPFSQLSCLVLSLSFCLRLLYLLADNKTQRHFRDLDEAIDVDSEAYCWRRSGFFWRMRASLGLACAQATTLSSQVFGKGNPRSRAGRPSI